MVVGVGQLDPLCVFVCGCVGGVVVCGVVVGAAAAEGVCVCVCACMCVGGGLVCCVVVWCGVVW